MSSTDHVVELLVRELDEVASELRVPPLPELPAEPRTASPRWLPLLAAAAVLLVLLGAVAAVSGLGDDRRISPAPAPEEPAEVSTDAPLLPYVLDTSLYVDGEQVPGRFGPVSGTAGGWLARRLDGTWVWGNSDGPHEMDEWTMPQGARISTNGRYVGAVVDEGQRSVLTGFETAWSGEGMLGTEVPATDDDGVAVRVGAVTDDGWFVASGRGVGVLVRPYVVDAEVVDLTETAPGQLVWQATPAGLVVVDGSGDARGPESGDVYLADVSAAGELTRTADLPNFGGDLAASTTWLAWADPDSVGGEVESVPSIEVRRVDGSGATTLSPPQGWGFRAGAWAFEDDDTLVAAVVDEQGSHRMVRCAPALGECVLLDLP